MSKIFLTLFLLLLATASHATVFFEDNFDSHPDWEQIRSDTSRYKIFDKSGVEGTDYPTGWSGYYLVKSALTYPTARNGIVLDSVDAYGGTGKSVKFMDEGKPFNSINWTWTSDALLSKYIPGGKSEVYVQFKVKFDSDYTWCDDGVHSPMKKFFRAMHYIDEPGLFYTNFSDGGNWPATVTQFGRGQYDINMIYQIRPDPSYDGTQADGSEGPSWYFDLPNDSLPIGNYNGTGTGWDDPGMFGDGSWHTLEYHIKADSSPGADDGMFEMWLDGNLQVSRSDIRYRETGSIMPDSLFNSFSIGGNSYNPWMGTYGTIPDDEDEQGYAIDDFVMSSTYIGTSYVIGDATPTTTYYYDEGDGYGDGTSQSSATDPGTDWYTAAELTATTGDCDNTDVNYNPTQAHVCLDGKYQDTCGVCGGNGKNNIRTGTTYIRAGTTVVR